MYEAAAINRISFGSTHLRFQLGIFRFESIAIAFKFLHFRLQHVQLVVGDFQLFLGAMDVQERRDAYEKTPPGPIPDLHKCTNIPLNTANGQFLGKSSRLGIRVTTVDGDEDFAYLHTSLSNSSSR